MSLHIHWHRRVDWSPASGEQPGLNLNYERKKCRCGSTKVRVWGTPR